MRFIFALLMLAAPVATQAQLTPPEARIVTAVEADAARSLTLLERLVAQNSGTMNAAGVEAVGAMMRAELEPLDFTVQWIDMRSTGRAGHIVATHRGNGRGQRMLLIGHLDTVFEPSSPFQAVTRDGDRLIGPGVGDDKGGMVVIVGALRAMQAAGTLADADIMVVLTGDEEDPGAPLTTSRADLLAAGEWADVALEFENLATDDGQDFGSVARRSSASWTLTTRGRTGHSSGVFSDRAGFGAIYEMARILDTFRRELREEYLTYNVGLMAGGTPAVQLPSGLDMTATGKSNIIPDTAIARGDLRALTPEQEANARTRMAAIVAAHLPGTEAELVFEAESYPPLAPTAGNRALLARLNGINRDMGLPEMAEYDPARRGAADSSFVAGLADVLAGLGAAGGLAHAEGEWLDIPSLTRQAQRAAILMTRLSRERRAR